LLTPKKKIPRGGKHRREGETIGKFSKRQKKKEPTLGGLRTATETKFRGKEREKKTRGGEEKE